MVGDSSDSFLSRFTMLHHLRSPGLPIKELPAPFPQGHVGSKCLPHRMAI